MRALYQVSFLCRIGRWLVQNRGWAQLDQLQRADLIAYMHQRQADGLKPSSIGTELSLFRTFWRDLLEQELVTNGAVLLVKAPAQPKHLPRYLPAEQFQRLEQVLLDATHHDRFNRAWFYLLAHPVPNELGRYGGLRVSEAINLRLGDCDLTSQSRTVQ